MEKGQLCPYCNQEIKDPSVNTCMGPQVLYFGPEAEESRYRIMFQSEDPKATCPGCGVRPNGLHHRGCEKELCPKCNKVMDPNDENRCFCE